VTSWSTNRNHNPPKGGTAYNCRRRLLDGGNEVAADASQPEEHSIRSVLVVRTREI
jgi:hypothetical protein